MRLMRFAPSKCFRGFFSVLDAEMDDSGRKARVRPGDAKSGKSGIASKAQFDPSAVVFNDLESAGWDSRDKAKAQVPAAWGEVKAVCCDAKARFQ
jgi:hypothetical protein